MALCALHPPPFAAFFLLTLVLAAFAFHGYLFPACAEVLPGWTPVSGCMFQSCCGRGAPRRFLFLSMSHGVLLTFWWPAEVWVVHMCAVVAFCGLTLSWSAGRLIISIGWCWKINPSERSVVKEMRCGWTLTHGPLVVVWFQLSFRSIFCLTFHLRPHLPPVGLTPVSGCMFQSCCGRGAPRRFLFLSMSHGVLLTFWWPAEVWWSTCVLWSLSVGWPCHGLQAVWSSA